jgi:Flp pilus assembly pilin Flp
MRPTPGMRRQALRCWTLRRWSGDTGATVVEYALLLSLLVGGSLTAVAAMVDPAVSSVQRQAACAEQRPAPSGCRTTGTGTGGVGP